MHEWWKLRLGKSIKVLLKQQIDGGNTWTIIWKVLIPESLPALISGITVTAISLVGYTAMAGVIGAGGLGNLAYLEGFQRNRPDVTLVQQIAVLDYCIYYSIYWGLLLQIELIRDRA